MAAVAVCGLGIAVAAARAAMAALTAWGVKKDCPGSAWGIVAVEAAGAEAGSNDTRRKVPLVSLRAI